MFDGCDNFTRFYSFVKLIIPDQVDQSLFNIY